MFVCRSPYDEFFNTLLRPLLHPNADILRAKTTQIAGDLHNANIRFQLQLNRGKSRHSLARRLFFANRGVFRSGDYAKIMNKVSALNLRSNAVLVRNTVRIGAIVDELEATAHPVDLQHDRMPTRAVVVSHVAPFSLCKPP